MSFCACVLHFHYMTIDFTSMQCVLILCCDYRKKERDKKRINTRNVYSCHFKNENKDTGAIILSSNAIKYFQYVSTMKKTKK